MTGYLNLVTISFFAMVSGRTILDLTHTFDGNAPKWPLSSYWVGPNFTYFDLETLVAQSYPDGMWVALKKIEFYEHMGTHMDAPLHFGAGRQAMHEVPPQRLMGPGVMIDVRAKASRNLDYVVSLGDIKEYEDSYGRIPPNAIVLMNSGWSGKYHDPTLVFGTKDLANTTTYRFPGFSIDACKMLLQDRQVSVVGVDTPSIDPGNDSEFKCHRYLQPNNVPLLEYVANLDIMPPRGSTVVLGALKHRDGTGGPTRVLAFIDDDEDKDGTSDATTATFSIVLLLTLAGNIY